MSWQTHERRAARALGTTRTIRPRGTSAPDMPSVVLPTGDHLQPEVKLRRRLPKLLAAALAQAQRYAPNAIPLAVVAERGGRALAVLDLRAFARLVGVDPIAVPPRTRRRRPEPRQLPLLPIQEETRP